MTYFAMSSLGEVEQNTSERRRSASPSLLDEMTEGMALSMLIFLIADLRLMSATGRVRTKFEILALDSDYMSKTRSEKLAGVGVEASELGVIEGLTPSQLMAIVLIEMRQAFDASEDKEQSKNSASEDFVNFAHSQRLKSQSNKSREDQMHALLKAYSEMLGADLKAEIPHIEARRSMLNLLSSSGQSESGRGSSATNKRWQSPISASASRRWQSQTSQSSASGRKQSHHIVTGQPVRNININLQIMNERRKELMQNASSRDAKQINEITDAVFKMGNADPTLRMSIVNSGAPPELVRSTRMSNSLSSEQLLKIMIAAVESRDAGKLDFMTHFFKDNTISQLMVRSRARVVWFNDWYPVNDLTYAIAVDPEKRRVLVVFRGAITRHDWSKAFDSDLRMINNPIQENFEGKTDRIGIYSGFHDYLFRVRKDTGTTKYHEIAAMAHKYGVDRIGEDYQLVVTGHSLGAALSTMFSFFASTEERFTKNGPIKMFTFGSPYIGGHEFADCFRHQEEAGRLLYARFFNHNDTVAFLPGNFSITKRGSKYRHVGIGVKIPHVPFLFTRFRQWHPRLYYVGDEGCLRSYRRGIGRNALLRSPWLWQIPRMHSLEEMQKRVAEGRLRREGQRNDALLHLSIEELYKKLAGIVIEEKKPSTMTVLPVRGSIRNVEPLFSGSYDEEPEA